MTFKSGGESRSRVFSTFCLLSPVFNQARNKVCAMVSGLWVVCDPGDSISGLREIGILGSSTASLANIQGGHLDTSLQEVPTSHSCKGQQEKPISSTECYFHKHGLLSRHAQ